MRRNSGRGLRTGVQTIFANLRSENEFGKMMRSGIETLKSVLSGGDESEVCYMAIHVLFSE